MRQYLVFTCLMMGCTLCSYAQQVDNYEKKVHHWHENRMKELQAEDGWLNLAGRFWLDAGRHSFGSDKTNKIVFPEGKCPASLGHFRVQKDEVWVDIDPQVKVLAGGKRVTGSLRVFPTDTQVVLQSGSLRWFVVKRDERYVVRLRDLEHPALQHFTGVERYPVDSTWRVTARLEPAVDKKIPITNVLGKTSPQNCPGTLVFTLHGTEYRLDAVEDDDKLFILFADSTSGVETYGTGRFLYADPTDEKGLTVLDFNYAINPPCAFTAFAICPLPPSQNRLGVAVTVGEKTYGAH